MFRRPATLSRVAYASIRPVSSVPLTDAITNAVSNEELMLELRKTNELLKKHYDEYQSDQIDDLLFKALTLFGVWFVGATLVSRR